MSLRELLFLSAVTEQLACLASKTGESENAHVISFEEEIQAINNSDLNHLVVVHRGKLSHCKACLDPYAARMREEEFFT